MTPDTKITIMPLDKTNFQLLNIFLNRNCYWLFILSEQVTMLYSEHGLFHITATSYPLHIHRLVSINVYEAFIFCLREFNATLLFYNFMSDAIFSDLCIVTRKKYDANGIMDHQNKNKEFLLEQLL